MKIAPLFNYTFNRVNKQLFKNQKTVSLISKDTVSFTSSIYRCPIYALNLETKEVTKYDDTASAACAFGYTRQKIYNHLSDETPADGYVFVRSIDVETKQKDGSEKLSQKRIDEIFEKHKPNILVINLESGEYQYYRTISEASSSTGLQSKYISKALNGYVSNTFGYIIKNAAELRDRNGNIDIQSVLDEKRAKMPRPIYQINIDGSFEKFRSVIDAENKTGVKRAGIYKQLKLKTKERDRSLPIYVYADEVEVELNNKKTPDIKKIQDIIRTRYKDSTIGVDLKEKKYREFESLEEGCSYFDGVKKSEISECKSGKTKIIKGRYMFFNSDSVKQKDEQDRLYLDDDMVKEAVLRRLRLYRRHIRNRQF